MTFLTMKGIFAVYKPKGPTSHDIVDRIRKITGVKKGGHAGTLDPLARGVLVIGVGREATKKLHEVVGQEKEYIAKIRLGMESTTDDEEGEKKIVRISRAHEPARKEIDKVLSEFKGQIFQTPPKFSALKIKGKSAYELARAGKEVKLEPRRVYIKEIEVLRYSWPYLTIRAVTGQGVYIRSIARDIGRKLHVGGYLADLERTRVGEWTKRSTIDLSSL